jgi:hypothetical protein
MRKTFFVGFLISLANFAHGDLVEAHGLPNPQAPFESVTGASLKIPGVLLADNTAGGSQGSDEQVSKSLDGLEKGQETAAEGASPVESTEKPALVEEKSGANADITSLPESTPSEATEPPSAEVDPAVEKSAQVEAVPTSEAKVATYASPEPSVHMERSKPIYSNEKPGTPKIGSWMINLGTGKPNYSEVIGYKDFYGTYSNTMDFGIDWYFLKSSWGALGLNGRFSYYADRGSRLKSGSTTEKAPGSASFTVQSKVIGFSGVASPFPWHWVVLKGWVGRQYDSFEETRDSDTQTTVSSSSSASDSNTLLQKGKKQGFVKGAAVLFNLSFLDGQSVNSLKPAMGLNTFYLAPFRESYEQKSGSGFNLSRSLTGVMFIFGSAY